MSDTMIKISAGETDEVIEVPKSIAIMSATIKNLLDDLDGVTDMIVPLPNVTMPTLIKVMEYCKYHHENKTQVPDDLEDDAESTPVDHICDWDKEFCTVDQAQLFEYILAANYLDIKPLLDLTCKTVASMIANKTTEEIRVALNIVNDFTPEEEEQIQKENEWCEER